MNVRRKQPTYCLLLFFIIWIRNISKYFVRHSFVRKLTIIQNGRILSLLLKLV